MKETKVKTERIHLGTCHVDSGQILICDPTYIGEDFASDLEESQHTVYKHNKDNFMWQFTYGKESKLKGVNAFPGTYSEVIPQYGKTPNQLIKEGLFIESDVDTMPSTEEASLTYDGIRKALGNNKNQLKHRLGHEGAGVAFNPGFGDGSYQVYAEVGAYNEWGKRVKRVIIECIDDDDDNE